MRQDPNACVTRTHTTLTETDPPEIIDVAIEFDFHIPPGGPGGRHEPPSGPDIDLDAVYIIRDNKRVKIPNTVDDADVARLIGEDDLDGVYDDALESGCDYYDDDSHPDC